MSMAIVGAIAGAFGFLGGFAFGLAFSVPTPREMEEMAASDLPPPAGRGRWKWGG